MPWSIGRSGAGSGRGNAASEDGRRGSIVPCILGTVPMQLHCASPSATWGREGR